MTRCSVLFPNTAERALDGSKTQPACFGDLNLDQIIYAVTEGKEEYDLTPFFYAPLSDVDTVIFRHEVMQDLEEASLFGNVKNFTRDMKTMRDNLAQLERPYGERQKEWWFLDAVALYGDAVNRLVQSLSAARRRSRGLHRFAAYLTHYASSEPFTSLIDEAKRLKGALSAIRYNVLIRGPRVEVRHDAKEPDYSAEIEATFERFRQGSLPASSFRFNDSPHMNHIEARILEGVAQLHPETFFWLRRYRATTNNFLDDAVIAFDREIQFYLAFMEYIAPLKNAGLAFCYPRIVAAHKEIYDTQGFDLALAQKLIGKGAAPVCNDFYLKHAERIIVVSGPNQGGKTTFARSFGQLHYLASLGLPVPGTEAQLYLFDSVFTHFEREEHMTAHRGRLEDDLVRIHAILQALTPRSIVIINEIFASTALRDAIFLSKKIASVLMERDVLCVWVTFLDEMSSLSEKTVSMVSTVAPDNPARRTFKIVRQPADGLAYALSLAEKHRVTYPMIKARLRS